MTYQRLDKIRRLRSQLLQVFEDRPTGSTREEGDVRALPRVVQIRVVGTAAVLAVILIASTAGVGALRNYMSERARAGVRPAAPGTFQPTPSQLATLTIKPVQTMIFHPQQITDGSIAIDDDISTPVFSPYSGRVTKLIAKLGDVVEKGAPLLMVEASEFVQAQNDLVSARAQFKLAETNARRQHDLYDAQGAALRDWQQSEADLATATAALSAAQSRLRIFGKTDAEIAAMGNGLGARAASPEATIAAPIPGRVLQRQVGLGQFIQAGAQTPVFTIGDMSRVWLVANVRESEAAAMRVGEDIEVRVPAYPGRVYTATLNYIAPAIDPVTHRLPVRAEVDNRDGTLKAQMFATFSIATGDDVRALAVPQSAVIYEGETARVWVADGQSLSARQIRTGRVTDGMVEVADGLVAGDRVVTSGSLFIDRAADGD